MAGSSLLSSVPGPVLATSVLAGARIFEDDGSGWDVALGGLPFRVAASEQRPIVRQTAQTQKQQSDTSREPGEHSLAFWWLKAQSSFHGGAGQKYLGSSDTDNEGLSRYRFAESEGLDVFTEPGAVSLLPKTTQIVTTAGSPLLATTDVGYLYVADGATLTRRYMAPFLGQSDKPTSSMTYYSDTVAWGGGETIVSMTANGDQYFLATATGIYAGTGTGAATKIYTYASDGDPLIRYVKQRLMLALNRFSSASAVYELDPAAAAASPLPTALFSATRAWRWTAIADSPTAILVSGHNFARSVIYKVGIGADGDNVPILLPGAVVAEFPPFEIVLGVQTYLGTVIGVQTSDGFRVGVLEASGDFSYGGLLVEHEWGMESAAVVGQGNSFYLGWSNEAGIAGLARVDLSGSFGSGQSLRFPWASDLRTTVPGVATQLAVWDYNRLVFAVPGQGVYVQSHIKVSSGSLTTSRIRWDTLEPKLLRFARIRGEGTYGRLTLEVGRDSDDALYPVGAVDVTQQTDSGDMYVPLQAGQFFVARLTVDGAAVLSGYQFKAVPSQRPQRMIQIPLAVYDRESTNGHLGGGEGTARARLLALEQLESEQAVLTLQWLSAYPDLRLSETVLIESVEFTQTADPSSSRGWGGIAVVTLRTVE